MTGIRQRRWAAADEKPSGMAYQAALEAIRRSGIAAKDIDAVIVATTTPDVAMPSTAAILQDRLNLQTIPGLRPERGLFRLALRRGRGPRTDPLGHGPQRA